MNADSWIKNVSRLTPVVLLFSVQLICCSVSHAGANYDRLAGYAGLMEAGREASQQGALGDAARMFEKASVVTRNDQAKVHALLELARVNLLRLSDGSEDNDEIFAKLDWAYREIQQIGTDEQKLQAANNLGIIYTRRQDYDEAVNVFRGASELALRVESDIAPLPLGRFYANYARVLELSGERQLALDQYILSIKHDPNQNRTREAAISIIESSPVPLVRKAAMLGSMLLAGDDKQLTRTFVLDRLNEWNADQSSQELLSVLVEYYVAVAVDPPRFSAKEWPVLEPLADATGGPLRTPLAQLHAAYLDQPGKISESRFEKVLKAPYFWRKSLFSTWARKPYDKVFTSLLNFIAEYYALRDQPENAFVRYSLLWQIDPGNSDAGLAAARLFGSADKPPGSEEKKFYKRMKVFLGKPWFGADGRFVTKRKDVEYDDRDLWNMYWMYAALVQSSVTEIPLDIPQWNITGRALTVDAKKNRVRNFSVERESDKRELLARLLRQRGNADAAYKQAAAAAKHDAYISKGFDDTDLLSLFVNPSQPALLEKMRLAVEEAQRQEMP